ncbi:hypothetical protein M378DRAFT_166481 [Amanita muscaria Koide BX008]|uniref:Uncharacterized protein n=1 Tax=Amanita muscaria (strain Koide BX008) TaxID=946122 RepID=A0A0C2WVT3_AMAMK|nr:hypothetical protein M378DRAFT_168192 [Amanita muscaria Koide BX008]KIL61708.1 hypothetical protein M378DRAFT_166481 [Amanita muscaria Koide BX008]
MRRTRLRGGVKGSPEHMSIVPSLPPLVAHVLPYDKQLTTAAIYPGSARVLAVAAPRTWRGS